MGFRYSAATNTFVTAGIVGADEWRGMREVDRDNSEREILQWTWALPAKEKETAVEPLDWKTVMHRQSQYRRGWSRQIAAALQPVWTCERHSWTGS
jgi:hypothetical protein